MGQALTELTSLCELFQRVAEAHADRPAGDELTPTSKLKRKPIAAKYAAVIDALYTD
jgi:long-subunit acyl-CoA synthetase (AMP-forming)